VSAIGFDRNDVIVGEAASAPRANDQRAGWERRAWHWGAPTRLTKRVDPLLMPGSVRLVDIQLSRNVVLEASVRCLSPNTLLLTCPPPSAVTPVLIVNSELLNGVESTKIVEPGADADCRVAGASIRILVIYGRVRNAP